MALINKSLGAPLTASIARRGFRPNIYNGVLISAPQLITKPSGLVVEMAQVVLAMVSLRTGERYFKVKWHDLGFAKDRTERDTFLDGTADAPIGWQDLVAKANDMNEEYGASLPEFDGAGSNGSTLSLDEISDEIAEVEVEVA